MTLPPLGFGTSPYRPDGSRIDVEPFVRIALEAGYRMFDLAEMYGNERAVGRALRARDDVRIIGKLWRTNYRPEHVRRACEESLRRIGIDAFDLYLLHAPGALRHVAPLEEAEDIGWDEFRRRATGNGPDEVPLSETWEAMRDLVSAGLAANIGVSNFTREHIEALGDPLPAANEIPCWPFDASFIEWHAQNSITVLGYSPFKDPEHNLRWLIERGIRPITFSTNAEHIRESLAAAKA